MVKINYKCNVCTITIYKMKLLKFRVLQFWFTKFYSNDATRLMLIYQLSLFERGRCYGFRAFKIW